VSRSDGGCHITMGMLDIRIESVNASPVMDLQSIVNSNLETVVKSSDIAKID
jgi:hypothetical protein